MKTCPQNSLITPWLLGDLSPEEAATLEQHLATCPDCRAEVDALTPLLQDLQEALTDDDALPTELEPARLAALDSLLATDISIKDAKRTSSHRRYWIPSLAALAATLVLILMLVPDSRDFLSSRLSRPASQPETESGPLFAADTSDDEAEPADHQKVELMAESTFSADSLAAAAPAAGAGTFGGRGVSPPAATSPAPAGSPIQLPAQTASRRQSAFDLAETARDAAGEADGQEISADTLAELTPPETALGRTRAMRSVPLSRKSHLPLAATFVSSFNYGDPPAAPGQPRLHLEAAPSPLLPERLLVRIGVSLPATVAEPEQTASVTGPLLSRLVADWNPELVSHIRTCGYTVPTAPTGKLPLNFGRTEPPGVATTASAIFEVQLTRPLAELQQTMPDADLLLVAARGDPTLEQGLKVSAIVPDTATAGPSLRLTALVAALADQRGQSPDSATVKGENLTALLEQALPEMPAGGANSQLPELVRAMQQN